MAEALFGDINPGAKLPVTVARDVSQVPLYYNARPTAGASRRAAEAVAALPVRLRLELHHVRDSARRACPRASIGRGDGSVTVEVDVRNTGPRAGDEVVQVYVHDRVASVARPVKQLKGFERVTLGPGEQRTVRITLDAEAFMLWNVDMKEVVEPGMFDILVGPNSRDLKSVALEIA